MEIQFSIPLNNKGSRSADRWQVCRVHCRRCERRRASLCAGVADKTYSQKLDKGADGMQYMKRHVKCDETKPSCLNCMKWRGYCDGYTVPDEASRPGRTDPSKAKLIHTKKAPLILTEPAVNTILFKDSEERLYFDEWSRLSATFLSGGLGQTRLWTATMPQVTLQETTLRYGAMAVGALRKACDAEPDGSPPAMDLMNTNKHYLNAIIYYCEALRMQAKAKPTREGLRTALLSSLLFICFEAQRGNVPAALKHVTHGFTMLNELAACTDKAPDLVSIAPAPPALVQEILDCYKPLELQSRSFMGSYRKFFFPPKPQPQQQGGSGAGPAGGANTPPSHPGSPWKGPHGSSHAPTGLPSPQSQGSPQSQTEQTPPRPAMPQRPPGIAPFTKHSPYFRPKQSNIKNLEDMPASFSTFDEVLGYWQLLQRQMVQYIPLLTATTAQLALTKVKNLDELRLKLSGVKQHPKISAFINESRYWLQRWSDAFDPLCQAAHANRNRNKQAYLVTLNFRSEYLILYIYTAVPRFSDLATAQSLTPQYKELIHVSETLISSRPNCGFAMDSGWTWPLFIAAFGCRDAAVREDAMRVLAQYPVRNALRDSRVFRAIALKNRDVERENEKEGNEEEQWLRLRRRELVFEDLGTNIIFRSAQKNPATGDWELVEEVAGFMVGSDGRLDWHRQPISESASILSGVC